MLNDHFEAIMEEALQANQLSTSVAATERIWEPSSPGPATSHSDAFGAKKSAISKSLLSFKETEPALFRNLVTAVEKKDYEDSGEVDDAVLAIQASRSASRGSAAMLWRI